METFGAIAGLLLFAKIIMHTYLLSKTEVDFRWIDYASAWGRKVVLVALLPCMGDVPKEYKLLKTIINILYTISGCSIIVFLVWHNAFRK